MKKKIIKVLVYMCDTLTVSNSKQKFMPITKFTKSVTDKSINYIKKIFFLLKSKTKNLFYFYFFFHLIQPAAFNILNRILLCNRSRQSRTKEKEIKIGANNFSWYWYWCNDRESLKSSVNRLFKKRFASCNGEKFDPF